MIRFAERLAGTSLSFRIITGLLLGIAVGLVAGERVTSLQIVADAWIRLMQMTVLPYVMVSLIAGLGGLNKELAKQLAFRGGLLLVLFWGIAFVVIAVFPRAFPEFTTASFFSAHTSQSTASFDPLDLYIPSNPFHSMAFTVVPAVVLFSAAIGVALIGVEGKAVLIDGLKVAMSALTRVTMSVVALTPVGVFAIVAVAAGTMSIDELERLEVYFAVYIAASLYLSLWVIPMLISTLTPFSYRDVFRYSRNALITAFVTQSLFVVLPMLIEASRKMFEDYRLSSDETESLSEVVIPVTFNFPNAGKLLSLLFIPYASWYSGTPMEWVQYPSFLAAGLASYFAKAQVALPFLLDNQRLSQDLFQLYIPTGIVNGKFDTMVSAMNLFAFSVISTTALTGQLGISMKKILRFGLLSAALLAATVGGTRVLLSATVDTSYRTGKVIREMTLRRSLEDVKVYSSREDFPASDRRVRNDDLPMFRQIEESGVLRVGFDSNRLPFTFFNARGELVGFDIELVHQLAREMDVRLELIPMTFDTLEEQLDRGEVDLVGTIPLSAEMLQRVDLTESYLSGEVCLVVPDHRKKDFATVEKVASHDFLSIGYTGPIKYIRERVTRRYEDQTIRWTPITDFRDFFEQEGNEYDGLLVEVEIGTAWTLLYPNFTTVIPSGGGRFDMPLGFAVAKGKQDFAATLGRWLVAKRATGELDEAYRYWILGEGAVPHRKRWSVMDNVFGADRDPDPVGGGPE